MRPLPLDAVKAVIFDLDGTIYSGSAITDGASQLVELLKTHSLPVYYCTNSSGSTRQQLCAKLAGMGLPTSTEHLYSAAYATARYLAEEGAAGLYCFGSEGLRQEILAFGLELLCNPADAKTLVIGLDTSVDYARIAALLTLRGKECRLISCNGDKFFPSDNGTLLPGCGFIARIVEEALDRKVSRSIGKPDSYMLDLLFHEHGLDKDDVVMIGDSPESDIAMARRVGCRSILVTDGPHLSTEIEQVRSLREICELFAR